MKSETLDEKALRDENARAQEALRISEERNRDLVENSAYGIFRVSADGSFVDGNPTLLRMTGCASAEDLLSLNLARDIFRFPEQYVQLTSSCWENGRVHGAEAEWRRRDGGLVTVRMNVRQLTTAGQPASGGPATAARLLKMFPGLPVIFTSGYSADAGEVPAEGVHARYLQKPYSPTTLGRLVRETLDQHRAERPPRGKHSRTG